MVALGAGLGGWAWFLSGRSLQEATDWSGILAGFAAIVFGVAGLAVGLLALRPPAPPTVPASPSPPIPPTPPAPAPAAGTGPDMPPGDRSVRIGGNVTGVVVAGDDNTVSWRERD